MSVYVCQASRIFNARIFLPVAVAFALSLMTCSVSFAQTELGCAAECGDWIPPGGFQPVTDLTGELAKDGTDIKIGGYVKLDAIFDFNDAGDRFSFDPNSIPNNNPLGEVFTVHARQSRFHFDITRKSDYGPLHAFIEGDFFGSGNTVRLRHAYGEVGSLLVGQTWSLAGDDEAFPETMDFNGAEGNAVVRRPQIRWASELTDNLEWAVAVQESRTSLIAPAAGGFRNRIPFLISSIRRRWNNGHFYLSAGVGESRFVSTTGSSSQTPVWGTTLSVMQKLDGHRLIVQLGASEGNADFYSPSRDDAAEEIFLSAGEITALRTTGWLVSYQRKWNDLLRSNVSYRVATIDNDAGQSADSIHANQYFAVNTILSPYEDRRFDIGLEYLWGQRENKDRQTRDAHRLQLSFIFRFGS